MDVRTASLYGDLDEIIYMAQPPNLEVKGKRVFSLFIKRISLWD